MILMHEQNVAHEEDPAIKHDKDHDKVITLDQYLHDGHGSTHNHCQSQSILMHVPPMDRSSYAPGIFAYTLPDF